MRARVLPLLLLLLASVTVPSFTARAQEASDSVESYKIESTVKGRKVVTWVHLFARPPLQDPKFIGQIKDLKLDHVAVMGDSPSPELQNFEKEVQTEAQTPVVVVNPKNGFFKRLQAAWKLSFKNPERKPGPADYRYGLVSTVGETGVFAAMVFTTPDIPIQNAVALVVAQTLLSYANNVWNNAINHFLSSSFRKIGKNANNTTYFFRNSAYDYITSQIFKLIQNPAKFLTSGVQSAILMNTLFSGTGDVLISNQDYLAYQHDKVRLAKMNFYTFLLSNVFGALDLMQFHWMPVLCKIGTYDFRLSGAILIGYYVTTFLALKRYPEKFYSAVMGLEKGLKKIGTWITSTVGNCSRLLAGGYRDHPGAGAD